MSQSHQLPRRPLTMNRRKLITGAAALTTLMTTKTRTTKAQASQPAATRTFLELKTWRLHNSREDQLKHLSDYLEAASSQRSPVPEPSPSQPSPPASAPTVPPSSPSSSMPPLPPSKTPSQPSKPMLPTRKPLSNSSPGLACHLSPLTARFSTASPSSPKSHSRRPAPRSGPPVSSSFAPTRTSPHPRSRRKPPCSTTAKLKSSSVSG